MTFLICIYKSLSISTDQMRCIVMSSWWWEYHTFYLGDTRDLANNNDYATYVFNF